jgi:DNA-binding NarL/FixJ family response regulator
MGAVDMTVRIAIVDDDPLVRGGLRLLLESESIMIAGEAADGEEALALIGRERPDLVLLDIRMPGADGIAVTRRLRERGDATRVLVLTTFDTDELVIEALRAGANGFLLKDTAPAEIVAAVHRTVEGEAVLSPAATARLVEAVAARPEEPVLRARRRLSSLSERERQVALAIAEGRSNRQVAEGLHLSVTTVKTHISALFAKLGAGNRVEIARAVYDARLEDR